MSLLSCLYLLESILSPRSAQWTTSLRVAYLFIPILMTFSSLLARCVSTQSLKVNMASADILYGAVASSHRLLHAGFPAAIIAEWAARSEAAVAILDPLQIVVLSVALILSTYRLTTGRDDL